LSSCVESIGNRVFLIPPKGVLEKVKHAILARFGSGEKKFVESLEVPCYRPMLIELVVDDNCGVCPMAIEFVVELAASCNFITVKIYNMSYVEPPFPIQATPTFRVNERVLWVGIPIAGDFKVIEEYLKEAYVETHPELEKLIERLKQFAELHNLFRNPNDDQFKQLLYKLLVNIDRYGYPYCPCRPIKIPKPSASKEEVYELNKDKVCPCIYALTDVKLHGHCLCGLFWSKEAVDRYINGRATKYGYALKAIEDVEKVYSYRELRIRVLTGGARKYLESWIRKLEELYMMLSED